MTENRNAQQVREITDKLEQGIKELFNSERFKEYLTAMSKFYNYSFNNTLLIAMQKPDATLVAGYTSWQRNFDRHVLKGEKGIKILAPAPYKDKEERERIDPVTQKPILDADGKPVVDTVDVMRPAFKVVSVFDVSQTEGKELPDIIVDELSGSVENYTAFFEALKQESPAPIAFEDISGGAKGYYNLDERRIAIQEGMSEIQTVKTAIHEIAHAKLHAAKPDEKTAPEDKKNRNTMEVEAESVAYTVCQHYGIETSDYSFGYIAGWSSDKETKELKGSLETIRKTAAEMIDGIDEKLKVLVADKEHTVENDQQEVKPGVEVKPAPSFSDVPVYHEVANYAFEAGELDTYRASMKANIACRDSIEEVINQHYHDNRLESGAAKEVLEEFGAERVQYILANTVQQKDWDGRFSTENKEWAKTVEVCRENSMRFMVDRAHPGLTDLFINEVRNEIREMQKEKASSVEQEKATVESAHQKTAEAEPPKHRLTPEEKKIKDAVSDILKAQIAQKNDGMLAIYKSSEQSFRTLAQSNVKIQGNTVSQNGEPMFAIHRRFSAKKTQGCYRELNPTLEYVKQEKKQEKPSIREQLKTAAKEPPKRKAQQKEKKNEIGLE